MGTIGFADVVYPMLPIFIAQRSYLCFWSHASTGLGPRAQIMGTIGFADIGPQITNFH